MNRTEGSAMMQGRMPVRVLDSSSIGNRLSTLHNTADSGKRMYHVMKVRELLPEYSNFTSRNESSSQKESLPSMGKAYTQRTQPIRIAVTEREPQSSKHKIDVSIRKQPIRIVQKPLESPKRSARRRLDTAYDPPILQTKENIHPTSRKTQYDSRVDSAKKFKNVKSVGITKPLGENSKNIDNKKNMQRKSFLLPPSTITNRYIRNQFSKFSNTPGSSLVNAGLTKNHVKQSDHSNILEELPENLNKGNSNRSCSSILVEESPKKMEIPSLETLSLSEPKITPISTAASRVTPALLPAVAVQNDPKATQVEHFKDLANPTLSNKSINENGNRMFNTNEVQRPSVIVEFKQLNSPLTIARQTNKQLSPKLNIVQTPNIGKFFSPMKCSTEHRNSLCQFNHVVSSPIAVVSNKCSLSRFTNSLLIVDNMNSFKELCTGLESARISELPNECQSIAKSRTTATGLQPEISIDKQSLIELELKLKECCTLVGNLLRPNEAKGSVTDCEKGVHVEFPLIKRDTLQNIKESRAASQCAAEREEPLMPLAEKPLSVIKSPIIKKNNAAISGKENLHTAEPELSPESQNESKKYRQSHERESLKNTESKDISEMAVGSKRKSVNRNKIEPQERRRSARLAAKQMQSPITTDDSFQTLEKELNIEHAQSSQCTPCREKTPISGIKWGRRSERPLREYMVLKSANKFLSTPDPKRFHHKVNSEESADPRANESQVISAKIFNELHDLYSETP